LSRSTNLATRDKYNLILIIVDKLIKYLYIYSHFGNVILADLEDIFSRLLFKQIWQIYLNKSLEKMSSRFTRVTFPKCECYCMQKEFYSRTTRIHCIKLTYTIL